MHKASSVAWPKPEQASAAQSCAFSLMRKHQLLPQPCTLLLRFIERSARLIQVTQLNVLQGSSTGRHAATMRGRSNRAMCHCTTIPIIAPGVISADRPPARLPTHPTQVDSCALLLLQQPPHLHRLFINCLPQFLAQCLELLVQVIPLLEETRHTGLAALQLCCSALTHAVCIREPGKPGGRCQTGIRDVVVIRDVSQKQCYNTKKKV